jgi:TPR repeat protein
LALEWYLKSARGGHPEAPNFIGVLYDVGDGVPEDNISAYAWWLIGVNRGDDAPLNNMEFLGRKLTPEQMAKAKELASKLEQEMAATQKKP